MKLRLFTLYYVQRRQTFNLCDAGVLTCCLIESLREDKDIFERRTSTASGPPLEFLGSGFTVLRQIVYIRVKTASDTNLVAQDI